MAVRRVKRAARGRRATGHRASACEFLHDGLLRRSSTTCLPFAQQSDSQCGAGKTCSSCASAMQSCDKTRTTGNVHAHPPHAPTDVVAEQLHHLWQPERQCVWCGGSRLRAVRFRQIFATETAVCPHVDMVQSTIDSFGGGAAIISASISTRECHQRALGCLTSQRRVSSSCKPTRSVPRRTRCIPWLGFQAPIHSPGHRALDVGRGIRNLSQA